MCFPLIFQSTKTVFYYLYHLYLFILNVYARDESSALVTSISLMLLNITSVSIIRHDTEFNIDKTYTLIFFNKNVLGPDLR